MKKYLIKISTLFILLLAHSVLGQNVSIKGSNVVLKNWSFSLEENNAFEENIGQQKYLEGKRIYYSLNLKEAKAHFTDNGVLYEFHKNISQNGEYGEEDSELFVEFDNKENVEYVFFEFLGCNDEIKLIPSTQTSWYNVYESLKGYPNIENKGLNYKKLIYKNVYPDIDIEFTIPKEGGLKYTIITHQGADINQIKLMYEGIRNLKLNSKNELKINSHLRKWVDHAPVTFLDDGITIVNSSYTLLNDTIGFYISDYDSTKTYHIDPWIALLPVAYNGFSIDFDDLGNSYVWVKADFGSPNINVLKFNSSGTLLWQFLTAQSITDLTVMRSTGEVFLSGTTLSPSSVLTDAYIGKLSTDGVLIAELQSFQPNNVSEFWQLKHDPCNNQVFIGAGGSIPFIQGATIDEGLNLASLNAVNIVNATNGHHDVATIALDPDGVNAYMIIAEKFDMPAGDSLNNILLKVPSIGQSPVVWSEPSNHFFLEGDIGYVPNYNQTGYNGSVSDLNFLYTTDGVNIKKWDKMNGNLLLSIPTGNSAWAGGIDVDICSGNIFVGGQSNVRVFDSNLNLINTITVSGDCYDVVLDQKGLMYATGDGFVSELTVPFFPLTLSKTNSCNCDGTTTISGCNNLSSMDIIWSPSGQTTETAIGLCPGWHTVNVSYGCTDYFTDSIFVESTICGFNVMVNSDTICVGECIDLLAMITGSSQGTTFSWNQGITETDSVVTVCPTTTTTYRVIATNPSLEVDTAFAIITVLSPPDVNLGNDIVSCSGSIVLDAGNSGATYLWGNGTTSQTNVINSSGTYFVEVSLGGCTDQDTINVQINNFVVDLGVDIFACTAMNVVLDAGSGVGNNYIWQDGSTNQTLTINTAGTYFVDVVTSEGCASSDTIIVSLGGINVNLGNDAILCGGELTLDAGNIGANYLWQDGTTMQTLTVDIPGTYIVNVDAGGCLGTDTIIVMYDAINIDLGPDLTSCSLGTVLVASNGVGDTYIWQDGSTAQTFTITAVGDYSVEVTNLNGCVSNDTLKVSTGSISVNLGPDQSFCSNPNLQLDAGNVGTGNTYIWQDGSTNQLFNVTSSGTYFVNVSEGTCVDSDTIKIFVEIPLSAFTFIDTVGCSIFQTSFMDMSTSASPIVNWEWNFGDNTTSNNQHPTHQYLTSGTYSVTLTITSQNGCTSTLTQLVSITIFENPTASFSFLPSAPLLGEEIHFIDESSNATSWLWKFKLGESSTLQNPLYTYNSIGNYTITLIVQNGNCIDSVSTTVGFEEGLIYYVPNAFTPDGDEHNNVFFPVFTTGFDPYDYHLEIFNRWGEIIFESYNVAFGWDGTYAENGLVQDGVYIWKISFGDVNNDKRHYVIGHVSVLK